jgi:DNA mismatch endonuclease (patch repair protein)
LDYNKVPGKPDIAYVGRRVAIFVHGCFWHRCPHCSLPHPKTNPDYWERKFVRNGERDARKMRELEEAGWRVLVLWECQVKKNIIAAVEAVRAELSKDPACADQTEEPGSNRWTR